MPPKPDRETKALLSPAERQVMREQNWAFALWMDRRSFDDMRRLAREPEEAGGLGYDLSLSALKGLVNGARQRRGDLATSREDRRERMLYETDERARAAIRDLRALYAQRDQLDAAIAEVRPVDIIEASILAGLVAKREKVALQLEAADRRLDAAQKREADLVGADAPTTIEVIQRDALDAELDALLSRLGEKPKKKSTPERTAP